jgi:hypothetical protein
MKKNGKKMFLKETTEKIQNRENFVAGKFKGKWISDYLELPYRTPESDLVLTISDLLNKGNSIYLITSSEIPIAFWAERGKMGTTNLSHGSQSINKHRKIARSALYV